MQDVIELTRVTKDPEVGYIEKVKKVVEWRDIISLEECNQEVGSELGSYDIVMVTLSYGEIAVEGAYETLKTKWIKYRKQARKEEVNPFNQN